VVLISALYSPIEMTVRARDRRNARRYVVALPLEWSQGRGLTRNVSESGVYFETNKTAPIGSAIRMSMVLGQADPEGRFRVECEGEVLRVEPHDGRVGIAARITSYRLERHPPPEAGRGQAPDG
jgi:hypothetical protein